MPSKTETWPELPYAAWKDTCATLQLWTQIVGKIRLVQTPWLNHSWHVVLYVTPRGLTTSPIPMATAASSSTSTFSTTCCASRPATAANRRSGSPALRGRFLRQRHALRLPNSASTSASTSCPTRSPTRSAFSEDRVHASYDRDFAQAFWRILLQVDRVLERFRTSFIGKCSPVHFFWGSFDLAVTRFSGRRAPFSDPGGVPNMPER